VTNSLNTLLEPTRRPAVVTALAGVIDSEVGGKSGIGGTAIKAAYKSVQKVRPGAVDTATNQLLPEFLGALQPFWDSNDAGSDFGEYLTARGDQVSDALLAVTDRRTADANPALAKAYSSLRGKAQDHVRESLPALGSTIQQQMSN